MIPTRRWALGLLAGATLLAGAAAAETYPSRVIRMVVPYPAGGPTDVIARVMAEELGRSLGQNVIVENLAGASGAIGTRAVAKAEPDGYTIMLGNNQTHGNNMFLLANPGYDAVRDFAPLAGAGAFEHVFVVSNRLQVKTIPDLVALARKDPGKLNYGSTGLGSGSHLSTELFMVRTGTKMTHVPFRGAAPLVQELMAARIDVSNATLPSVLGQIQSGDVRAIAIASPQRTPSLPDVPTLREQGIADADAESWTAFFAPAAVPKPILDRIAGEMAAILGRPDVKERLAKLGFSVNAKNPEEFRAYHAREMQTWADVIRTVGLKPETVN
jgi:tripartite-type tricarboxylate transporter receptor subunit TctC